MDKIETKLSRPLTIVFIVMIALFLVFCGGALSVTMEHDGMMGMGWNSGISWMWVPALLFLTLSVLLGWVVFAKVKKP